MATAKKKTVSAKKKTAPVAKKKTVTKAATRAKKTSAGVKKKSAAPHAKKLSPMELAAVVSDADRARWIATADTLTGDEVGLVTPMSVLLGEAVDAVRFLRSRWEPEAGEKGLPGLVSAVRRDLTPQPFAAVPTLHAGTADELLALHTLTQQAQTQTLLSVQLPGGGVHPRVEGGTTLANLRSALESFLDDGVETDDDARLAALHSAHDTEPGTDDALAAALIDYAALASSLRPALDHYGDFSPDWITRANALANELRVTAPAAPPQRKNSTLLATRNGLATLLLRRIRLVRAKARFVFREHPAVLREVTSAYERRRSADRRRAKKAAAPVKG